MCQLNLLVDIDISSYSQISTFFSLEDDQMLKQLRSGWSQISRLRDSNVRKDSGVNLRDIKVGDIKRTILASNTLRGKMQVIFGWVLVGIGLVGVVMPVIPGAFLVVLGAALAGWRHPLVEKIAEPMFRVSEALPEHKVPAPLRPLWAGWRRLDTRQPKPE